MPVTLATPFILTDPGYILWAPPLSTLPTNTVVGGVFTDTWPVAWIPQGATEDGSEFSYSTKVEPISVAEFFDPIRWATTERTGSFAFNLADYTLKSLSRAMNGATVATVSGAGTTLLSKLTPVTAGSEVRSMIGWESLDRTLRIVAYQCLQGGEIKTAFKRVPSFAVIPVTFNFEKPTGSEPFEMWAAGPSRLGV